MERRKFLQQLSLLPLILSVTYAKESSSDAWNLGKYGQFEFEHMHKNLYIMHGINRHDLDAQSQWFINNPAFIESKNGLIVIDAGGSHAIGKQVLKQIERISKKPIIAIFMTHNHGDHWFATGALKEKYPKAKLYGHKNLEASARIRYFENIGDAKKNFSMARPIFYPTEFVDDGDSVEIDGEKFEIEHPPFAHTNSDITIAHKNSNTLFTGDLVLRNILANFGYKSSIRGNIRFLEKILKEKHEYQLYVPGHGHSGSKEETIEPYYKFLKIIEMEAQRVYDLEEDFFTLKEHLEQVISKVEWEEIEGFDTHFILQYLEHIYLEIEEEARSQI